MFWIPGKGDKAMDGDGYKCEQCGAQFNGQNAKADFRDHVMRHEYRRARSLYTPFKPEDRVTLKVNKIYNDYERDDAA